MTVQYRTVAKLGETIHFGKKAIKASFKSSTSAVFNLSNRAFYIEGQAFSGDYRVGDYFTRDIEPDGNVYMVATVLTEPTSPDLCYLFGMQCNCLATFILDKGKSIDENGDLSDGFETVAENIPVYRDFTTRQPKQSNDGALDQGIYTMYVPHKLLASYGMRVRVPYNVNGKNEMTDFIVDNVGTALGAPDGSGIDALQLTLDTRSDIISKSNDESADDYNADIY